MSINLRSGLTQCYTTTTRSRSRDTTSSGTLLHVDVCVGCVVSVTKGSPKCAGKSSLAVARDLATTLRLTEIRLDRDAVVWLEFDMAHETPTLQHHD